METLYTSGAIDVIDLTDSPTPTAPRRPAPTAASGKLYYKNATQTGWTDERTYGHSLAPGNSYSHPQAAPRAPPAQLASSSRDNTEFPAFGSSLTPRPKASKPAKPATVRQKLNEAYGYGGFIKPATAGAFDAPPAASSPFQAAANRSAALRSAASTKSGLQDEPLVRPDKPAEEDDAEVFDVNAAKITAEDYNVFHGDAEEHMKELLAGAVGEVDEGIEEGEDVVEGFASSVRLMPHQVRGVKWMKEREKNRKYGGILADDMGLGKTVQTLARVVEGKATAAEKKAGYKGTLIVAPLAVMEQWATECRTKTEPGVLRVTTHHGPTRAKLGKKLEDFDVVITTFTVLSTEFGSLVKNNPASAAAQKMRKKKKKASLSESDDSDSDVGARVVRKKKAPHALFDVKWLRIVVDEAQNIKNHNTLVAKGAVELVAKYRWCLTGTPIQNNVTELYSLFKFLRAKPMHQWETFRDQVAMPVKRGQTKLAMKRLHYILKAIMLRRTKDATIDGKPILNLPGRTVEVVQCEFDQAERDFYSALEKRTALTFNKFLRDGTAMSSYTSVLTMLLRLRQACDHPTLVASKLATDAEALESKAAADADEADELADMLGGLGVATGKKCEICYATLTDTSATHCTECVKLAGEAKQQDQADTDHSSAKIRKLLELLAAVEARSAKREKTIVFSQFTSFLNLIEPFLRSAGIAYVRYDGSVRAEKREQVLETIKTDPAVRVILISFKSGSTGLNLTCCNNVILMDLWWNPALEDQAFDRAHRLGQKLDVNIYKLTIAETVEDRILALQGAKRELARAALSGGTIKNNKLTLGDMMKLFKSNTYHGDHD
ncbi:hypothetical protein Q5752_006194 [Cryptotrichosporon argae]